MSRVPGCAGGGGARRPWLGFRLRDLMRTRVRVHLRGGGGGGGAERGGAKGQSHDARRRDREELAASAPRRARAGHASGNREGADPSFPPFATARRGPAVVPRPEARARVLAAGATQCAAALREGRAARAVRSEPNQTNPLRTIIVDYTAGSADSQRGPQRGMADRLGGLLCHNRGARRLERSQERLQEVEQELHDTRAQVCPRRAPGLPN